jgi:ATPase subunit of ABC transporter with duplicated ATPase domains
LDVPAILWLQNYLASLTSTTLLIVSHDRSFLNSTAEEIIVLKNRKLTYHPGNYDDYQISKEEKKRRDLRRVEALEKKRAHVEKSIREGLKAAKKHGDDKKLGMVASRRKVCTEFVLFLIF